MRMVSSRLYSTFARRGLPSSLLASTQGAFSSIYLLAREMTLKTSARAFWKAYFSICSSYLSRREDTMAISSASFSSSAVCTTGRRSPKYFCAMATVRETRLPRSLARSTLMVLISASLEKLPSEPKGKERSRKKRRASTPKRSAST